MKDDAGAAVRPQDLQVSQEALALIQRNVAERYRICPLSLSEARNGLRMLTVAAVDPANLMVLDQLQQISGCRINAVKAAEQDLMRAIDLHYGRTDYTAQPTDLLQQYGVTEPTAGQQAAAENRGASGKVEEIMQRAIAERASDIHLEPHNRAVYVRYRIDGVMYDQGTYSPADHAQVISRIKILAKLDISQNRLPQDGRFDVAFGQREFDVRVSVAPAIGGEKAVLRILPKGAVAMDFDQLGLSGKNLETLMELLSKPFGMVLATGPTGSGKTTTLYACLAKTDCVGKNVITIEDPVEYQFARITQLQVHPKIGLTFAAGLRSILRQDPDIIMVGEIRDLETLQMAMQSALTGHMVLSTMHCNDAAAAAARMIDMGAEPFLIASSLNGIVAQRLVRKICEKCRVELPVLDQVREKLGLPEDNTVFYHGKGCPACRNTGYMGRVSVYEVIPTNEEIQHAIVSKASASEIRNLMRKSGHTCLRDDGLEKARAGITTLEEVMRAVYVDTM